MATTRIAREEVPPLNSELAEEAEEEVNNPAGGARGGWRRCGLRGSIFAAR